MRSILKPKFVQLWPNVELTITLLLVLPVVILMVVLAHVVFGGLGDLRNNRSLEELLCVCL